MKTLTNKLIETALIMLSLSFGPIFAQSITVRDQNSYFLTSVPPNQGISYVVDHNNLNVDGCKIKWNVTNATGWPNNAHEILMPNTDFAYSFSWNNVNANAILKATLFSCTNSSSNGYTNTYSVPIRYLGYLNFMTVDGIGTNPQTLQCGVQTVTVTAGTALNATNYQWDFSNLSGWSSSGNTASVSATTSANTGGTIYVTATRSDAPNVSSTASITIQRPSLNSTVLTGPQAGCIGQSKSYTINGLPTGTSVSWSASGTVSLISSSGGNASINLDNDGLGTLTANITGCGTSVSRNIDVFVGQPYHYDVSGLESICSNYSHQYNITNNTYMYTDQATYTWSSSSPNLSITGNGPSVNISSCCPGTYIAYVAATNSCGTTYNSLGIDVSTCFARSTIFPNPATDNVQIEFDQVDKADALPDKVDLISEKTMLSVKSIDVQEVHTKNAFKEGNKIEINVKDLPRGIYYLQIINSRQTKEKQIESTRIVLE